MDKNSRLEFLLQRFREGQPTAEELDEMELLLDDFDTTEQFRRAWDKIPADVQMFDESSSQQMLALITAENIDMPAREVVVKKKAPVSLKGAVLVLLGLLALWVLYKLAF